MRKRRFAVLCLGTALCIGLVVEHRRLHRGEYGTGFEEQIVQGDKVYQYDTSVLTYLVMGIDKGREKYEGQYPDEVGLTMADGQADAIFLCVLHTKTGELSVVSLNRNTMTEIAFYNDDGIFLVMQQAQLAIQHGFGREEEESCKLQLGAVQRLMHGIPIHGYLSVDMTVIEQLNQSVGGVTVEVLEDMQTVDPDFIEGNTVCLRDDQAFWYVKYRDTESYASADRRLERQKQFLVGFMDKAMAARQKDMRFPFRLYADCREHLCTDLSPDSMLYLLWQVRQCTVGEDCFYDLPGETRMGVEYEEFYVDEEQLTQLITQLFYEEK